MDKFSGAVNKFYPENAKIERVINAETITCFKIFDEILEHGKGFLIGVTVGRSNLSASMGIAKKDIECEEVFNVTKEFCEKAKNAGLTTNFGGNIGIESIPFIINMFPYIDRFETRKVVISKNNDPEILKEVIAAALEFELMYLRFKSQYYLDMANEDSSRIQRLEKQIGSVRKD